MRPLSVWSRVCLAPLVLLASLIPLGASMLSAAPAPLYSQEVTLKALRHPSGALDALRYLHQLTPTDLLSLKSEPLLDALDQLALNPERSLQVRAWSISIMARFKVARPSLRALLQLDEQHKDARSVVLARAAALALRGLSRPDLLSGALKHPDPEVRGHAAASGADPALLCERATQDPWPQVRYEAVRGLIKIGGARVLCLQTALKDPADDVQERAAYALGALTGDPSWSPTPEQRRALIKSLRDLAGAPAAPLNARSSAFVSLARWGDLGPSEQALKTHLDKGGITPLAVAALKAISSSSATLEVKVFKLSEALEQSRSLEVRLQAASALARLDARAAKRTLMRAADRVGGREGARYLKLLEAAGLPQHDPQPSLVEPTSQDPLVPSLNEEDRAGL